MPWGFDKGRTYNRRADIHGRFDGQRQGGIITPAKYPLVLIVTGEEGLTHGYQDRYRADGVFEYFGEGQVGDMTLTKGNQAVADHLANGKSLLLFRKIAAGLRFEGEMACEGFHREPAPDRTGAIRDALVFHLRPLEVLEEVEVATPAVANGTLSELRKRAFASAKTSVNGKASTRTIFERSENVRAYVLARADGSCEGCGLPAPFVRVDGSPYLEPHHTRRVSDGGPDDPRFVASLCPTCHRRVHAGIDGKDYNARISTIVRNKERELDLRS